MLVNGDLQRGRTTLTKDEFSRANSAYSVSPQSLPARPSPCYSTHRGNSMKRTLLIVLALLCAILARDARAQASPDLEKAIADLESKWAAAQKDGKADVVSPLLADRFITIGTDGKLATKDELLAHMKP